MANTKTTIELNGTVYDATTGKPVEQSSTDRAAQPPKSSSAVNMDGFIPPAKNATPKPQALPKKPVQTERTVKHLNARQPARASTLMRHAIEKPAITVPESQNSKASSQDKTPSVAPTAAKTLREERAMSTTKSDSISRFGKTAAKKVDQKVAHMPVQAAPAAPPAETTAHVVRHAAPAADHSATFTSAIAHATSHEQPKLKKQKLHHRTAKRLGTTSKIMSVGAASLAILLLVGFVAYQNVPNFQMRLAAARAGFNASLPDYTPSGFALNGGIQSTPGEVTFNFHSNSDDRGFQVSQKPSNWTSESLLSNHVATSNRSYQTYEDRGKTIYIYDGTNATWVNGGVWYEVRGDSSLNSDQLIHIANSF